MSVDVEKVNNFAPHPNIPCSESGLHEHDSMSTETARSLRGAKKHQEWTNGLSGKLHFGLMRPNLTFCASNVGHDGCHVTEQQQQQSGAVLRHVTSTPTNTVWRRHVRTLPRCRHAEACELSAPPGGRRGDRCIVGAAERMQEGGEFSVR